MPAPTLLKPLPAVLLAAALSFSTAASAASPVNFLYEICAQCAPGDVLWSEGEFDQIRRVPAEAGALATPARKIDGAALVPALMQVQAGGKPWLDAEAAQRLAQAVAAYLAQDQAQRDGVFLLTVKSAGGFIANRNGVSGRVFADAGGVHLIIGESGVDFISAYRATRMQRAFQFGSRQQASNVRLSSPWQHKGRADWLYIPLQETRQAAPAPLSVVPLAAPAAVAPAAVAPPVRDEKFYAEQEMRLKSLKRMREQGLLTEEEYQAKRRVIVEQL
ncbi:SHOCT domain-containing protein [Massilia sp. W12]|uniref:SHOCT domain-containing protein n=1 Tax=Massilia sp. W12 TaxID=3126507 RepID=UPI0030CAB08F